MAARTVISIRLAAGTAVLILAAALNTGAQQPAKVYRVGFLGASPPPSVGWSRTWGPGVPLCTGFVISDMLRAATLSSRPGTRRAATNGFPGLLVNSCD